jgi:DNA (cytosine-5)-methyltransferase 1
MLTYLAIADKYRPRWLVWENVPGVLSSNGGKDFGVFLGALGELGYGFAYRVLDAQYFGVAQRRRRVFVVGYLGDWRAAAAVLFERHSLSGHPAPSREKREDPAKCLTRGAGQRYDFETEDLIPAYGIPGNWIGRKPENGGNATEPMHDIAPCLTKADQHGVAQAIPLDTMTIQGRPSDVNNRMGMGIGNAGDPSFTLTKGHSHAVAQPIAFTTEQTPKFNSDQALTLTKSESKHNQCVMQPTIVHGTQDPCVSNIAFAQGRNNGGENVMVQAMAVRRLTPTECERLQGFPDNYTDIKSKSKPTPDGPRYKALGNSMAVPVMAWIGQRIQEVEAICKQNK